MFNLGSLNEGQRDVANQFLKEPRLQAAIALFDEQRDFTNKGAERGLNLQSLMNRTDDSFLKEALRLLIIGSEEVAERQADVAESIAENNMKLSNQMQGLTDASLCKCNTGKFGEAYTILNRSLPECGIR